MSYVLPDGNVLISFSGGRTSGYMLHKILEANGGLPDRAKVVFTNTGREDNSTLDFVMECEARWNCNVDWLEYRRINNKVSFEKVNHNNASKDGEPFEALLSSSGILPNVFRRYCTQELKVRTIKRYLVSIGWKRWVNTVGIRADEARRVKPSTDNRWVNWFPLNDANATKKTVMDFWKSQPFDLKITPGYGNCVGCFLKSEATLASIWRDNPEHMKWWADQEQKKSATFNDKRSYDELGYFVKRQGDFIFNDEAYLCQTDEGECTG